MLSVIILSFFFVHCKRDLWNAFFAKSPDGRSFGDMRPGMGSCADWQQMSWGLIWGAFLAMQTNDRELVPVPPSAGRLRSACPFSEKKKLLLCAHKTRADTHKACRFRLLLPRRSFVVLAWMCICK